MRSLLRPSHRLEAVRPECQRRSESGEDLDQLRCLSARQVCWQPLHWPGGPSGRAALPLKVPLQLAAPQGQIHHVQLLQPLIKLLRRSLLEELRFFFPKEWGGGLLHISRRSCRASEDHPSKHQFSAFVSQMKSKQT